MILSTLRGKRHQRFVHFNRMEKNVYSFIQWMGYSFLFIFISSIVYSQQPLGRVTSSFRISSDSTPSTFEQYGIQLFPGPDSGFIAMWQDYREGDESLYAQNFDKNGNKIGSNYKSPFKQGITFLSDGSSLRIDTTVTNASWDSRLWVTGTVTDPTGTVISSMPLGSAYLPWCATGYLGIGYHYSTSLNNFYFLFSDDGRLSLSRIHKNGTLTSIPSDTLGIYGAYSSSINATSDDEFMIAWSDLRQKAYNDSDGFRITHTMESWGTFYGANDSLYKHRVPLGMFSDTLTSYPYTSINKYSSFLQSICLQDSVYEVFAVQRFPLSILYRTFDKFGNPLDTVKNIPLSIELDYYGYVNNLVVSEVSNSTFKVLVGAYNSSSAGGASYTALTNFDFQGNPVGQPLIDTMYIPMRGDRIINIDDSTTLVGIENNKNVYLVRYQGLRPLDSILVNDDSLGSNEYYSKVTSFSSSEYFVVWKNEQNIYGQKISTEGEYEGTIRTLDGYALKFFPNGTSVNLWYRDSVPRFSIGFSVRDANWNVTNTTLLFNSEYRNAPNHSYTMEKLTDSTFVVGYANSNTSLVLKLFNVRGEALAEYVINLSRSMYHSEIILQDSSSFLLRCSGEIQKFSSTLQPLNEKTACPEGMYLATNMILATEQDYPANMCHGRLYSLGGDTLSERFVLSRGTYDVQLSRLTDNTFIALANNGNTLYARTFFNNGQIDHDSMVIYTSENTSIKNPSCTMNDGNVLFTWSEKRLTGRGYDIYGSMIPVSSLLEAPSQDVTLLPKEYTLYQNFPNPFNPSTTIKYYLPEKGNIAITVYDVLGKQVAQLVDGFQYIGEHSVTWNAEGMPSGVYFYRVSTNNFSETKKLLLMR